MGESLPAEGMARLLENIEHFQLVDQVQTLSRVRQLVEENKVDVLILIDTGSMPGQSHAHLGSLLSQYPGLPIIRANIDTDKVQVITSHCVDANLDELTKAISKLSRNGDTPNRHGPVA